ncbi:MAG: asparagine--tRNA ligase [Deltaproteobacteria bacterium]|nr:asparagine--tRNA ligase [Deltaproteobacteria bacterium]
MINQRRSRIRDILSGSLTDKEVEVWGWIRTSRFSKTVSFISVNDGSCFDSLQLVVAYSFDLDKGQLLTGSCVRAKGQVVTSPGIQKFEVQVRELSIVSAADERFPLQKKRHSQEFLREIAHLRPRTNTHLALGFMRNTLATAIHGFFQARGFKYVHSPILTKSDCEGGGETFLVTALDPKKIAEAGKQFDWKEDLFGQPVFLSVSGQLEAEAMALAFGEVYTFAPTFRADPSETTRHASEFWMVEPEMAFYDFEDLRDLVAAFIKGITETVWKSCQTEIQFFNKFIEPDLTARYSTIMEQDFGQITFYEAQELLRKSGKTFEVTPDPEKDLATEHERYLVDEVFKKPLFVTHYPKVFKPFYMRQNEDGKTVACMDLLVPQVGEIVGGSQREERYDRLLKTMKDQNMNDDLRWYLETRLWGSAPHSGFGLGFERMLMYLTGMKNIKDVLAFPRASRRVW